METKPKFYNGNLVNLKKNQPIAVEGFRTQSRFNSVHPRDQPSVHATISSKTIWNQNKIQVTEPADETHQSSFRDASKISLKKSMQTMSLGKMSSNANQKQSPRRIIRSNKKLLQKIPEKTPSQFRSTNSKSVGRVQASSNFDYSRHLGNQSSILSTDPHHGCMGMTMRDSTFPKLNDSKQVGCGFMQNSMDSGESIDNQEVSCQI